MTVQIRRWQFTVADFARIVEAGILAEDDRVELIDGEVRVEYDREEKIPRYAQTFIPEVWLIDVERTTVTQYTQPDGTRYGREQTLARGQRIVSDTVSYLHLSVDGIFG